MAEPVCWRGWGKVRGKCLWRPVLRVQDPRAHSSANPDGIRYGAPSRQPKRLVAARALARSTSGGVLLADEGYRGSDLFDWLYEEAQVLCVMPS